MIAGVQLKAAAPAITSASSSDVYYDAADPTNGLFSYRIVATNAPTRFEATGLPVDMTLNESTGWITGNRASPGLYEVTVRATNTDGSASSTVRFSIHPAVVGVRSSPGAFHAGQRFTFTVHYNSVMTVTGSPQLAILVGPAGTPVTKQAAYVSGSGTSDLVFEYAVSGDDRDPDGVQILSNALHDGSICDANGLTASPALPVKYFASGITILNDPTAPSGVVSAAAPGSSRLANVSSRLSVAEGDSNRTLITGFVVKGTAPKRVLLRGVGPALAGFGVAGALSDPRLQLFAGAGRLVADNDNWSGTETSAVTGAVGAFRLAEGAKDSATVITVQPGAYTLVVMANGGTGVALAEIYDADGDDVNDASHIANLSTRGYVEGESAPLIAGFTVKGTEPRRVLIRGIGPALAAFGVVGALSDPTLKIYQADRLVAQNDNWSGENGEVPTASVAAGAFALATGSRDASVVLTLAPGAYSAVVSGAGNGAGVALVEVYEL